MLSAGDKRVTLTRGVALMMTLSLFVPTTAAYAQGYDLGSTSGTIQASHAGVIKIGGTVRSINAGDMLTPAEFAALNQITSTGRQSLNIGAAGSAIGGRVNIGTDLGSNIGSLVIPQGVNALGDFSKITGATFALPGNLVNSGNLYGYSTNAAATAATFQANNILNNVSGLISTVVPFGSLGIVGALQSLDLNLSATGDIVNNGVVRSSGALNATAGGAIVNTATMEAAKNVNLHSAAGQFANSGSIASAGGSINITSSGDVAFNNTNGVLSALVGDINVRDISYSGAANVGLLGGDWLSRNLNIYSGSGDIEGVVGKVSGELNSHAGIAHIAAETPVLVLGDNCITGDPTFANIGGDIVINGIVNPAAALSILASGNITATAAGGIVNHGQPVIMVAGANIALSGGGSGGNNAGSVTVPPGTAVQLAGGRTATVDFTTGGGGNIDLSSSTVATVIDTSATAVNGAGGAVTLAALANGTAGGRILLNTTSGTGAIDTRGNGTGAGGAVNVFAGGNPGAAATTIQLNGITTGAGGNGGAAGGAVNVFTSQPTGTGGTSVTFADTGLITVNGPLTHLAGLQANGQIVLAAAVSTSPVLATASTAGNAGGVGGAVSINAGNSISAASTITTSGGNGANGTNGAPGVAGGNGGAGGNAGALSLQAATGISLANSLTAIGGVGGAGGGGGGGNPAGAGGSGGNGGTGGIISVITTAGPLVMTSGTVNSSGGTGGASGNAGAAAGSANGGNNAAVLAGLGGNAGSLTMNSTNGSITITANLSAIGGNGGNGGAGGSGGGGGGAGGGAGGSGRGGGSGSTVSLTTAGALNLTGLINSFGGLGGNGGIGGTSLNSGGAAGAAGTGGNGGTGGSINLSSTGSTIRVTGLLTSDSGAAGSGGTGGARATANAAAAGGSGGNGTAAGSINLTSASGVTMAGANARGGAGGAGGNGGSSGAGAGGVGGTGGVGGFGGGAGSITVSATSGAVVDAGNLTATGGNGGKGGNGGNTGAGGTNGTGAAGGASGNGAAISATTTNFGSVSIVGNVNTSAGTNGLGGSAGTGGAGGAAGAAGTFGQPDDITIRAATASASTSGVSVTGFLQATSNPADFTSITALIAPITLSGNHVSIFGATSTNPAGFSIAGGSSITITSTGATLTLGDQYSTNGDLTTTSAIPENGGLLPIAQNNFLADNSGVNSSASNGTFGALQTRTGSNITINTLVQPNPINTSTPVAPTGTATIRILTSDGAGFLDLISGASVSPSTYIAAIQSFGTAGQTLIPTTAGVANSGSFVYGSANAPTASTFSTLVLPSGITMNVTNPVQVIVSGATNLASGASMVFGTGSSNTLNTGSLLNAGTISTSIATGTLTISAASNSNIVNNGAITGLNNVALNVFGSGTVSGTGAVTAPALLTVNVGSSGTSTVNSAASNLGFSGGGANLTVVDADDLTINGGNSLGSGSLSVSSTNGNLVMGAGAITADGGISLSQTTAGKTISGAGVLTSTGALTVTLGGATTSANIFSNVASLNATGSGGSLTVTETDNITLNNGINLSSGSLTVGSNSGSITVGAVGTDTVVADGGITLSVFNAQTIGGAGTLQSTGTVALNVGASGTSTVNTAAGSLAGTGSGASLVVTEADAVTLNNGINYGGGSYTVNSAGGDITVGSLNTDTVIANGGLTVGVTGVNVIGGNGTLQSTGTVTLNVGNTNTSTVKTSAGSLTGTGSGGNLTVNEANAVTLLNGTNYAGGTYTVNTTGAITLGSSSSDTITSQLLVLNGGSITGSGVATGNVVNLTASSGSIGSAASRLNTNANTLTLTANSGSVYVNEADGANLNASSALTDFVVSAAGDLNVNGDITADPVFLSVSNGNININSNIIADGGILIVSSRNITVAGNKDIDGRSTTGNAGAITMVAGAAFTDTPGTSIDITGASAQGGNITFNNGDTLRSSSTAGSGGNVSLIAFEGSGGGAILLPAALTLTTGGSAGNNNGSVTMVAGSSANATNLSVGAIDTTGGNRGTGTITLTTSTPNTTVTIGEGANTGVITAGTFLGGAVQGFASLSTGALTTNGAAISLTAGNNISTGTITTSALTNGSAGSITATATIGGITTGNITADGLTSGSGGGISLTALSGAINFPATLSTQGFGVPNSGGTVNTISSTITGTPTITATGASGANGGSIIVRTTDSASDLTLGSQLNVDVSTVGGAPGVLNVRAGGSLTVDSAISGVGNLTLRSDNGALTINASTSSASASFNTNGGNLGGTGTVTTAGGLSITANGNDATLNISSNTLVATMGGGSLSLAQTGKNLNISSVDNGGGTVNITNTNFDISVPGTMTGDGAVTLDLTSGTGALTISPTGSIDGIGSKTLSTDSGAITLNGPVTATGDSIALTSGGGITQGAAGVLTASSLTVTQTATNTTANLTTANNAVGTFNIVSNGTGQTFSLNNSLATAIGTVTGSAVNNNPNLTITASDKLTTSANFAINVNDLTLQGTNTGFDAMTISHSITAQGTTQLTGLSGGDINILGGTFTANGPMTLTSSGGISISGTAAILGSGTKNLNATSAINIVNSVPVTSTGGNINLTAGNTISAASGILTANTVSVTQNGAGKTSTLNNASNSFNTIDVTSNGAGNTFTIRSGSALDIGTIGGSNSDETLSVTSGGLLQTTSGFTVGDMTLSSSLGAGSAVDIKHAVVSNGTTNVNATGGGNVVISTGSVTGTGSKSINAGAGAISLNGALTSSNSTVSLSAGSGINQTATGTITGNSLTITQTGLAQSAILAFANNSVGSVSFVANGNNETFIFNNPGALDISSVSGSGSNATVTVTAGPVTFPNTFAFTGVLSVGSDDITVNAGKTITATDISFNGVTMDQVGIGGPSAGAMQVNNYGTLYANGGILSITSASGQDLVVQGDNQGAGIFQANTGSQINIEAQKDVANSFFPNLYFTDANASPIATTDALIFQFSGVGTGVVNLTANGDPTTYVEFSSGIVNFQPSVGTLNFNCCNINQDVGNNAKYVAQLSTTVNLNCPFGGTIANSTGNIDLSTLGSLTFNGTRLAILSAGSIINSGGPTTIDLSGGAGAGGDLLLVAGFSFTPATAGTVGPDGTTYTLDATNTQTGSISLNASGSEVAINTSGGTNGGNVQAYANGPVALSTVDTSGANGTGGSIDIIGSNIVTSTLTTTGTSGNGAVTLTSGAANQGGGTNQTVIQGGKIQGTNFFQAGPTTGVVLLGGGSSSTGDFSATGSTISFIGALNSNGGDITASGDTINVLNTVNAGAGTAQLTATGDISGPNTVAGANVNLNAGGSIYGATTSNDFSTNASSSLSINAGGSAQVSNGAPGQVDLAASATGDLKVTNLGSFRLVDDATGSTVSLTNLAGDLLLNGNDVTATTTATISSGDITGTGTVSGTQVSLTGNNIYATNPGPGVFTPLATAASTSLALTGPGTQTVSNTGGNAITLNASGASGDVSVSNDANLTLASGISANSVSLTSTNGNVDTDVQNVSATTIASLNATGDISGTGTVGGQTVSLDAGGDIHGALSTNEYLTNATNTLAISAGGSALIANGSATQVDLDASAGGALSVSNGGGGIRLIDDATGSTVSLAAGLDLLLNGNDVTATTNVDVNAGGNITGTGTVSGTNVIVNVGNSAYGTQVGPVFTNLTTNASSKLTVFAGSVIPGGFAHISNAAAGQVDVEGIANGELAITTDGSMRLVNTVSSVTSNVSLTSTNGSILLNGNNVNAITTALLNANGDISGGGSVNGATVDLTSGGDIFQAQIAPGVFSALNTNASSALNISAGGFATVLNASTNQIDLDASAATSLDVTGTGSLRLVANATGDTVSLQSTTGSILMNGNNVVATTSAFLGADVDISGNGNVQAPTVTLSAANNIFNTELFPGFFTDFVTSASSALNVNAGGFAQVANTAPGQIDLDANAVGNLSVSNGGNLRLVNDAIGSTVTLISSAGDILLNSNDVTATTNAVLFANGDISGVGVVGGTSVTVTANGGDIFGSVVSPGVFTDLTTNATSSLSVSSSGFAQVSNAATTQVDLFAQAPGDMTVTSDGGLRLVAAAIGDDISLTSINGSILLNGFNVIGNGSASLTAGGDITGVGTVGATNVSLSAGGSIYETNPSPGVFTDLATNASNSLTVNATTGDAHVSNASAGLINLSGSAGGNLAVTNGGDLQLSNDVTGGSVNLTSTAGSILLNGFDVTATNDATLTADDSITGVGTVSATNLTLVATNGDIYETNPGPGVFTPLAAALTNTPTNSLDVTAGGSAYINATGNVFSINATVDNAGTFDLTGDGILVVDSGKQISGGTVNLTSTATGFGASIVLDGNINATDVTLSISSSDGGFGAGIVETGSITANTLTVNSNNNTVGEAVIVDLGGPNNVGTLAVNFQANTDNSLIFTNSGTLTLNPFANVNHLTATADAIIVASSLTLTDLSLTALAGDVTTNALVTLDASNSLSLTASGDLNFGDINGTSSVTLSAGGAINQTVGTLVTGGDLNLSDFAGPLTLETDVATLRTGLATSGEDLTINEANGIGLATVSDITLANLTINASQTTTGDISVDGQVIVTGNVVLTNSNAGNISGFGNITADNLNVTTDAGDINLHTTINSLDVATNGNVTITEAGDLTINGVVGNGGLPNNITIAGTQGNNSTFTFNDTTDVIGTGDVFIEANRMFFSGTNSTVTGNTVSLSNFPNDNADLLIIGTTTLTSVIATNIQAFSPATGPQNNLTFGSNPTAPNPVTDITFVGGNVNLISTGDVQLLATAATDTQLNSANTINIFANGITLQGTFNAPVTFTSLAEVGTISNPSGDVVLPANLIFTGLNQNGRSLAILAQGNIMATSKVNSINLSNKLGSGGQLTLIAGYDFHQLTPGQQPPPNGTSPVLGIYVLDQPSLSGGSILLPKVNINTSSTFTSNVQLNLAPTGGRVVAIASGPSGLLGPGGGALNTTMGTNSGAIALGTINTSANTKVGNAGEVLLIGQGGVQTGAINATGANGGKVTIIGSAPTYAATGGQGAQIINGVLAGVTFTGLTTDTKNGAAVFVNGAIKTSGSNGKGGDVFIQADQQIELVGGVTATGFFSPTGFGGGSVRVQSDFSSITIGTAGVNTSALSLKTTGGAAGDAGDITLLAQNAITSGTLKAVGGTNTGTGSGGAGGIVDIETNDLTVGADTFKYGTVTLKGSILTTGGSAASAGPATAQGGAGGAISIDAGNVIGTSINAAAGKNAKLNTTSTPQGGLIDIHTYASQALPTNLDLTSAKASISQLPGGMFSVGLGGTTNGFTGTIVTSTFTGVTPTYTLLTNNKANMPGAGVFAGQTNFNPGGGDDQPFNPTGITQITFNITNQTAGHTPSVDGTTGKRIQLTPSQALRLYQLQRGDAPITVDGTTGVAVAPGTFTVDQIDTNGVTFTGFKIPTGFTMNITGDRPSFNLPASTLFGGTVAFMDANSIDYINLNGGALSIGSKTNLTAALTTDSTSTLILSGTGGTYNNFGTLSTGNLVFARTTTAGFTFIGNLDSTTDFNKVIMAPSSSVGMALTFKALGAEQFGPTAGSNSPDFELGNVMIPTMYKTNAIAQAANASVNRAIKLNFQTAANTTPGTGLTLDFIVPHITRPLVTVTGGTTPAFSASTVSLTASPVSMKLNSSSPTQSLATEFQMDAGAGISATGSVLVNAGNAVSGGGQFTLNSGASLTSTGSTVTLKATGADLSVFGDLNGAKGVSVTNTTGSAIVQNITSSAGGVTLSTSTGFLAVNATGKSISSFGTLTLKSAGGNIQVGQQDSLTGKVVSISTTGGGDITVQQRSNITATGGAVTLSVANGQLTINSSPNNALRGSITSNTSTVNLKSTAGAILVGNFQNLTARTGINVTSTTGTIGFGNSDNVTAGVLTVSPDTSVVGFPTNTPLLTSQITAKGSIIVTSGATSGNAVSFGDGSIFTSNGNNIVITAKAADISVGNSNQFTALGGNVEFLAKGNIAGQANNIFQALGTQGVANGGVEFGAGTTASTLSKGFGIHVITNPSISIGTNIDRTANAGVILAINKNATAGSLDMGTTNTATFNLNNGVVNLNNAGTGSSIIFDGGEFQTVSSKPIAYISPVMDEMNFGSGDEESGASAPVSIVDSEGAMFRTDKQGALVMHRGEVLMEATGNALIKTVHGMISAKRGALVHIVSKQGKVYIKACTSELKVTAHGVDMILPVGQELMLSVAAPTQSDLHPSDGVGRRKQHVSTLADGASAVVSDFSMISLIANLPSLRASGNTDGRKVIDRMLKTAAAIDVVTRSHGVYTATPKQVTPARHGGQYAADADEGNLKPVSYASGR